MDRDISKTHNIEVENKDEILEYLVDIKSRYLVFKRQLELSEAKVKDLENKNLVLSGMVADLTKKLDVIENDSNKKRRKTNSLDNLANVNDSTLLDNYELPLGQQTNNLINKDTFPAALNNTSLLNEQDSTTSSNQQKQPIFKTPQKLNYDKAKTSPVKILSPVNRNTIGKHNSSITNTHPINKVVNLPRRVKLYNSSPKNIENKKPDTSSGWLSKSNSKKNSPWQLPPSKAQKFADLAETLNSSEEIVACSQDVLHNTKKSRNLRLVPKLRQAKLEFDLKPVDSKFNFKEDDDFVDASPTCTRSIFSKDSTKVLRTFKKISKKKEDDLFVFPDRESVSLESKNYLNDNKKSSITTSTPASVDSNVRHVKNEPMTVVKNLFHTNKSAKVSDQNATKDNQNNKESSELEPTVISSEDSSVVILKSQPDDVILIEESDFLREMGSEIFDEIANNEPESVFNAVIFNNSTKCPTDITKESQSEAEKFEEVKKDLMDADETMLTHDISLTNMVKENLAPKSPTSFHVDNCSDCQKFKIYLIHQNVPPDEMKKRLKVCKRVVKLDMTPDGYWDPCFQSWDFNDPRNETLIDYRYVDKKEDT